MEASHEMGNRVVHTPGQMAQRQRELARERDAEIAKELRQQDREQTRLARQHMSSRSNFSYGRSWKRP